MLVGRAGSPRGWCGIGSLDFSSRSLVYNQYQFGVPGIYFPAYSTRYFPLHISHLKKKKKGRVQSAHYCSSSLKQVIPSSVRWVISPGCMLPRTGATKIAGDVKALKLQMGIAAVPVNGQALREPHGHLQPAMPFCCSLTGTVSPHLWRCSTPWVKDLI